MRRLLLFRHGKSDWNVEFEDDHERPLAKRGKKAAKLMGKRLAGAGFAPDLILTSSALRAKDTAQRLQKAAGWDCPVRITRGFYEHGPEGVLEEIQSEGDTAPALLAVGHEPGWSTLASTLIGGGNIRMPTAAAACIEFDCESWQDVRPGTGQLIWLVIPRFLEAVSL